ncbi:hypothetical protein B0H19DRAFT_1379043 [Mycena capillaripes]|nr:hypothetical protein B0H19DRAFT_1379043 [Mycena capillaripes]
MRDSKQLVNSWIHRRRPSRSIISVPLESTLSTPSSDNPAIGSPKESAMEPVFDNLTLALSLAEQTVEIAQVAPFIAPAATLLSEILKSYREVKSANEKRDSLATQIFNLTGDICATVLRMEATNHSDLIDRLKLDLQRYAALIEKASEFIDKYDQQEKIVRWAARNQLSAGMHKLGQDLTLFGARFRTNRLVDLTINQSIDTRKLDEIHDMTVKEKLEKWLRSPPEMAEKQHDTERLRKDGTGRWFLEGTQFIEWEDNGGSLWIEGPSGAGKSVLSATVINQLFTHQPQFEDTDNPPPLNAVAFFHFDFREKERQSVEIVLRRITSSGQKLPSYEDFVKILHQLLRELGRTYIILDALDECGDSSIKQLLDLISTLRTWSPTSLHLLITNQPRQIFTKALDGVSRVALEFNVTQDDIRLFVASELETNPELDLWRLHTDKIKERITSKSNGMFRLAACLLLELSSCNWEEDLDEMLENLPADLFVVYDRFLQKIRPKDWVYVEAALRWIMFSAYVNIDMLSDALAFDFFHTEQYTYKPTRHKGNQIAIPKWLAGLIRVRDQSHEVRLAHASVEDYLLSNHIVPKFGLDLSEDLSHTFIARTCIDFFLSFGDPPLGKYSASSSSMKEYAERYWCRHLLCSNDESVLRGRAIRLLDDEKEAFRACAQKVFNRESFSAELVVSPLHFCCEEGYLEGVRHMLATEADVNLAGHRGTALDIASRWGHTDIVHLLLDNGADVNLPSSEKYGSALAAASFHGHIKTARLLLQNGADVNFVDGTQTGGALAAASRAGHLEIVHLLLQNGADVNLHNEEGGSALVVACINGHLDVVRLLLERGANVNLPCRSIPSALAAASYSRKVVRLLLESGAVVNLATDEGYCPLVAASCMRPRRGFPRRDQRFCVS